jgi:hypothetical protein
MSIPPTTQRVIIDGDLEIATKPGTTGNTLGRMVFTDKTIGDIGSVKVYGFSSSTFRLINDSAKIGRGASFRTFSSQGGFDEGGTGALYTMDIQNGYIRLGNYSYITPQNYRYPTGDFPGYLLKVEKDQATTASYAVSNDNIAWFPMRNFLSGQSQTINVGAYSGSGLSMGYRGGASVSYGFLGLSTNSVHSVSEYLKLIPGGIVEAISTLKATTVEASNWVGLPPTPPPDLLPITLDKTNNRVGINQTTPTHDLDVTGTINTQTYLLSNLPTIVYPTGGGMSVGKTIGAAGANTICMGTAAGQITQGSEAIAIGVQAGNNTQKSGAVSMGYYAGNVTQGLAAVAIGSSAGRTNQGGYSIAIGGNCGRTNQAAFNVAIGHECGMDTQSQHAVAIGATAGTSTQGTGSVAVGWGAGKTGQGAYAVAVGPRSGITSQHAGTICLNAANADLNTTQTNSLYINPIRNTTTTPTNVLTYNTTTKEVSYGPLPASSYSVFSIGLDVDVTPQSTGFVFVPLNVKEFDTGNNYSFLNNNLTGLNGYYSINCSVKSTSTNPGYYMVCLYKNGSLFKYGTPSQYDELEGVSILSTVIQAISTDRFQMWCYNSSTSVIKKNIKNTYLEGHFIRPI